MNDTRITVVGNLAADPTCRELDSGRTVTNFRVGATRRRYDARTSSWVDEQTSWWDVACFGFIADNAAASFRKGDRVVVSGRAWVEQWKSAAEEKSGYTARITADALGHDLTYGTSAYTRVARAREVPLPPREDVAAALGASVDEHGELRELDDDALARALEEEAVPV